MPFYPKLTFPEADIVEEGDPDSASRRITPIGVFYILRIDSGLKDTASMVLTIESAIGASPRQPVSLPF